MSDPEKQIIKKELKERTHFIILTSVILPVLLAMISLCGIVLGIVLPRILDKISLTSQTASTASSSSQEIISNATSSSSSSLKNNLNGYLSPDKIVNFVQTKNFSFTPDSTNQNGDYEILENNDGTFLIGYSTPNIDTNNIFLVPSSSRDYPKKLIINFKDISNINILIKHDKKTSTPGLTITATKVEYSN